MIENPFHDIVVGLHLGIVFYYFLVVVFRKARQT
jgi:hypothetical protein